MITPNRLQTTQSLQDWNAIIHVLSGAAGVAIGLMFATALRWLN
jgi:hypothetical protein